MGCDSQLADGTVGNGRLAVVRQGTFRVTDGHQISNEFVAVVAAKLHMTDTDRFYAQTGCR